MADDLVLSEVSESCSGVIGGAEYPTFGSVAESEADSPRSVVELRDWPFEAEAEEGSPFEAMGEVVVSLFDAVVEVEKSPFGVMIDGGG